MKLQQGKVATFILTFLMVCFWIWFFNKAPIDRYQSTLTAIVTKVVATIRPVDVDSKSVQTSDPVADVIDSAEACHGKPPKHGMQYLYSPETESLKQKSRLLVNNEHVYPAWITLYDADSFDPVASLYINPGNHSQFQLPIGSYEVEVQSGVKWCNETEGFVGSALLEPDTLVHLLPNQIEYINLYSYGSSASDMMFSSGNSTKHTGQQFQGSGRLVLQKVVGGHYAVHGSINQKPLFFLVDTGATLVSVPYNFAIHAGVKGCKKMRVTTANGVVEQCVGKADELVIGQFVFKGVDVVYSKAMPEGVFLLGMSILSQFKMVQQDGQMVLSRK